MSGSAQDLLELSVQRRAAAQHGECMYFAVCYVQ